MVDKICGKGEFWAWNAPDVWLTSMFRQQTVLYGLWLSSPLWAKRRNTSTASSIHTASFSPSRFKTLTQEGSWPNWVEDCLAASESSINWPCRQILVFFDCLCFIFLNLHQVSHVYSLALCAHGEELKVEPEPSL